MEGNRKCSVSRINNQHGRKVRRGGVEPAPPARGQHPPHYQPAHWLTGRGGWGWGGGVMATTFIEASET